MKRGKNDECTVYCVFRTDYRLCVCTGVFVCMSVEIWIDVYVCGVYVRTCTRFYPARLRQQAYFIHVILINIHATAETYCLYMNV